MKKIFELTHTFLLVTCLLLYTNQNNIHFKNQCKMKKNFYIISFIFLLVAAMQFSFAQTTNVTLDFTTDPSWDGSGNTGNVLPNTNDYGYRNIEGVTGLKEGDYGCIGGVFCRTVAYSYYADTDLNGNVDRTMTLKVAGSMKLENRTTGSFDGAFSLGYFDATNTNGNNFFGVMIKEPSTPAGAFRGVVCVNPHTNFAISADIALTQLTKIDFDLTYTGSADGSGTITGKLAEQDINITVPAGTGVYNSFGLFVGGLSFDRNERTRNCYFDDITYTQLSASAVAQQTIDMINVYPSTTTDKVNFNNLPENSRIELLDMTGRKLLMKNASELNAGLSLESYAKGLYLIKVMQGQENVKSVKVFKK